VVEMPCGQDVRWMGETLVFVSWPDGEVDALVFSAI
jgi:hypothetical protein